jgi:DNA repair protein RadC
MIKLTKTQKTLITTSADLAKIMRQILMRENKIKRQREHLWAIGLNEEFTLLYVELIAFGVPEKGKTKPMEIYRLALQKNATYLYLCHNRANADMAAQADDKKLTDRMIQVGKIVGIHLFDHVIINHKTEDHLSYADVGLMAELEKSMAWVPKFEQAKKIKSMAREEGEKAKAITIAKNMKKKKLDLELISQLTGLSLKEIEKL